MQKRQFLMNLNNSSSLISIAIFIFGWYASAADANKAIYHLDETHHDVLRCNRFLPMPSDNQQQIRVREIQLAQSGKSSLLNNGECGLWNGEGANFYLTIIGTLGDMVKARVNYLNNSNTDTVGYFFRDDLIATSTSTNTNTRKKPSLEDEAWQTAGSFEYRENDRTTLRCLYSDEQIRINKKNRFPGNSTAGTLCLSVEKENSDHRKWLIDLQNTARQSPTEEGIMEATFSLSNNMIVRREYSVQRLDSEHSLAKIISFAESGSFEEMFTHSKSIAILTRFHNGGTFEHYKIPTIKGGNDIGENHVYFDDVDKNDQVVRRSGTTQEAAEVVQNKRKVAILARAQLAQNEYKKFYDDLANECRNFLYGICPKGSQEEAEFDRKTREVQKNLMKKYNVKVWSIE